jgi:hypothetical protein
MTDGQRTMRLQQLARIVFDACLSCDEQFVPDFKPGTKAVISFGRSGLSDEGSDSPG